jgi:hypothetical protein
VRKKRKKFGNVIMLLLILFVLFYIFVGQKSIEVSAVELAQSYGSDSQNADKKFLNQEIELTGSVKTYYEFENESNLLKIKTADNLPGVFIIIKNKATEERVKSITSNTVITIYGICLGLNSSGREKFPNSIYIEAKEIK